jgi:hypothetical protein
VPSEGGVLVRNLYLSVDPAQRGWASDRSNYLQPVAPGSVMRGLAVGIVVESLAPSIAVGSIVYGFFGWQDFAIAEADEILNCESHPELPVSAYGSILGITGLTAFLALEKLAHLGSGQTVLVTSAAGAVGSIVGQLARKAGCRTIGLAGDEHKLRLCTESFGYDVAVNYKAGPVGAALEAAVPEGIDVFFDNVGGPILDEALRRMRIGGRVIQCGTAATQNWDPAPRGPRAEREILTRRLTWSGFVIFDHRADFARAAAALSAAIRKGELRYLEDIESGIQCAPQALSNVYAGRNKGKKLIYIGQAV